MYWSNQTRAMASIIDHQPALQHIRLEKCRAEAVRFTFLRRGNRRRIITKAFFKYWFLLAVNSDTLKVIIIILIFHKGI